MGDTLPDSTETDGRADVAVIVACYDQAVFLADALGSLSRQTRLPDEIILVDDGSTDDTAAVASRFPAVRYLRQDNAGLSAARNTGLAASTARYVLFLDADDWLLPSALEQAQRALMRDPRLAFVYGGYEEVDVGGRRIATHRPQRFADPLDALLRRGNFVSMHGTVLYDAARLRAAGGFDPALGSCEDYDVYLRLVRHHPIAGYDACAAAYRRHGASLSCHAPRMIRTARTVLARHARTAPERVAARSGMVVMTRYYCDRMLSVMLGELQDRRIPALARSLAAVGRSPWLIAPLMRGALVAVARSVRSRLTRRPRPA